MAGESKTTTDHNTIRKWAEERNGKPSTVKATHKDDEIGIIRIDFPGYSGEDSLEEISWEDFFEQFEKHKLALLYQEETKDGNKSNFFKIIKRES